jgi:cbb3-type cytochrome oxidase subunit 3
MDLDAFKKDWQQQQAPDVFETAVPDSVYQRYVRINKKMMRTNIITSVLMITTMFFIGWIWWLYQAQQGWAFDGSIMSIEILIVLVSIVFWSRVMQEKHMTLNKDTKSFLTAAIGKLKRTVYITKWVMPLYAALLNLSLVLYFYDLMKHKPSWFLIASVITTLYIVVTSLIGFKRHRKRQRKEVEPLVNDMEEVLKGIMQD